MYFVREANPKIVTEQNMYDAGVRESMLEWSHALELSLADKSMNLADTMEVYLEPNDESSCFYYIVDHNARVLFWMETLTTDDIGIRHCATGDHLRE